VSDPAILLAPHAPSLTHSPSLLLLSADPGNDSRYVNYVKDVPISWFETVIRSLAHRRLEIHRKFPKAESLKDCMERTIPYYKEVIVPDSITTQKNVLIASSE
jgi:2,3-bisphosphoglycerate-dependent phosphoglycerate mutase